MKSDKEGVNSMRLQATGKYIVWENCKTLLYVVLGLLGIGFFLSLLTGFFNNNVQPSVSGMDISILLILMGVGQFTFKRKMDFIFQNNLSASARAWGVYLGYIAFALGAFVLMVILVPVFTIALKAFGGTTKDIMVFSLYQNGVKWGMVSVILMLYFLMATITMLLGFLHYHMKPLQIALFWIIVYIVITLLLQSVLTILGGTGSGNALVSYIIDVFRRLIPWLAEKKSHLLLFEAGIFTVLSMFSWVGLYRLQLRKR